MGREKRSKFANDAKSTAELASSLAQKANQTDVRMKSVKISQSDVTEEFLQQMAGITPVNSIPQDESVSFRKLNKSLIEKLNGYRSSITGSIDHLLIFNMPTSKEIVVGSVITISFKLQSKNTDLKDLIAYISQANNPSGFSGRLYGTLDANASEQLFSFDFTIPSGFGYSIGQTMTLATGVRTIGESSDIYVYDVKIIYPDGSSLSFTNAPTTTLQGTTDITYSAYNPFGGLVVRGAEEPMKPLLGRNIITFGDSLTYGDLGVIGGVQQGRVTKPFPSWVADITGAKVENKGSGGSDTGRLVGIMTHIKDREPYSWTETPDYTNVDAVTIMIGTNGGVTGSLSDVPYVPTQSVDKLPFVVNSTTITTQDQYWNLFPNNFFGNVALCIEYVQFKNPKTKIYIITPPYSDRDSWGRLPAVRNALIQIAELYSVTVIDAQLNIGIDKKHLHKYSNDFTHLTELGYEIFGKYVAKQIVNN
jgi:lysophospholipase L1-like esterase